MNYADRGLQYDQEGANREHQRGLRHIGRADAALTRCPRPIPMRCRARAMSAAPDGPGGFEGKGYIWDAALRGWTDSIRNYGFFGDLTRYEPITGPPT